MRITPWLTTLLLMGCNVAPTLSLNEFMASNVSTLTDANGGTPDWIELVNTGDEAVDLTGFFLSDDATQLGRGPLPEGVEVEAGGYVLFLCDSDVTDDPQFLPFRLSAGGEELILSYDFGDGPEIVEQTSFTGQTSDVSMARIPDGDGEWAESTSPSPGEANE